MYNDVRKVNMIKNNMAKRTTYHVTKTDEDGKAKRKEAEELLLKVKLKIQ